MAMADAFTKEIMANVKQDLCQAVFSHNLAKKQLIDIINYLSIIENRKVKLTQVLEVNSDKMAPYNSEVNRVKNTAPHHREAKNKVKVATSRSERRESSCPANLHSTAGSVKAAKGLKIQAKHLFRSRTNSICLTNLWHNSIL